MHLLGKTGAVVSWTVVRVPPSGFAESAPYPVVLVQLENGKRIMAQLVDSLPEHLVVGAKVKTVVRRVRKPDEDGVIPYGIKVRPL